MQKFEIAKKMLGVLIVIGWGVVALAIFALVASITTDSQQAVRIGFTGALLGSGALAMFGLVIIAVAQMGLAQIATAENTGEMLEIMRKQDQSGSQEKQTARPGTKPISPNIIKSNDVGASIKTYKGYRIVKAQDGVEVDGQAFENLFAAEKWINHNPR